MQVVMRTWPARAVHDTVRAVLQQPAFRRSVRSTLLQRLFSWLRQAVRWVVEQLGGVPATKTLLLWGAGIIVAGVVARLVIASRVRDSGSHRAPRDRDASRREDAWRVADACEAAGDFEGAAHALYRAVLQAVARRERVRLDPSRTSGDYVRELRARGSSLREPFRLFARRYDVAIFGHRRCDAALVRELRELATPLRARERAA